MPGSDALAYVALAIAAAAAMEGFAQVRPSQQGPLEAELQTLARRRILLGHQSVGADALESTRPDGRAETVQWNGRTVPVLAGAYTDDGGHLNAAGRHRAARALVALIAALPAR